MYYYQQPSRNVMHTKSHLINVNGEGELSVQPDSASINLGVITENKELIAAQKQNSTEGKRVIDSLLTLGLPQSHLQTFDYRIESDYDYDHGKQIFRGYKITHILQVKMDDLSIIGKVVDTAVQNGVNYVSNVQFKIKNKDSIYQKALIIALNQAIEKAKTIANALNVNLNPVPLLVTEGGSTAEPFHYQNQTLVKGAGSTQIEPGQILVRAVVSAEFNYY